MTSDIRDELAEALLPWRGCRTLIASHNDGKLQEWGWLLSRTDCLLVGASELKLDQPQETETTYCANAELKARAASRAVEHHGIQLIIADDAGFSLDRLNGAPGLVTARFARERGGFAEAAAGLIQMLSDRGASCPSPSEFHCAVSLGLHSPRGWSFHTTYAKTTGSFISEPRGNQGFGFDSWFVPSDARRTFGEMAPSERDSRNHRALAVRELAQRLYERRANST